MKKIITMAVLLNLSLSFASIVIDDVSGFSQFVIEGDPKVIENTQGLEPLITEDIIGFRTLPGFEIIIIQDDIYLRDTESGDIKHLGEVSDPGLGGPNEFLVIDDFLGLWFIFRFVKILLSKIESYNWLWFLDLYLELFNQKLEASFGDLLI